MCHIYDQICHWRRNLFELPKGLRGKRFIKIMADLINWWCIQRNNEEIYMKKLLIMPSLLLQRRTTKYNQLNKKHLGRRLDQSSNGEFLDGLHEGKTYQEKAKIWKILGSNICDQESIDLRIAVVTMAKNLCTNDLQVNECHKYIQAHRSCRLIPLD